MFPNNTSTYSANGIAICTFRTVAMFVTVTSHNDSGQSMLMSLLAAMVY